MFNDVYALDLFADDSVPFTLPLEPASTLRSQLLMACAVAVRGQRSTAPVQHTDSSQSQHVHITAWCGILPRIRFFRHLYPPQLPRGWVHRDGMMRTSVRLNTRMSSVQLVATTSWSRCRESCCIHQSIRSKIQSLFKTDITPLTSYRSFRRVLKARQPSLSVSNNYFHSRIRWSKDAALRGISNSLVVHVKGQPEVRL